MLSRLSLVGRHIPQSRAFCARLSASQSSSSQGLHIMTSSTIGQDTRKIHTAACLIIGDEILGGKTVDTNSTYMARFCFGLGIELKRIEVIPDDEVEIIEAARRMSERYDFVVTGGGIGPTHDDITYQSIAKAFDLSLVLHNESFERMKRLSKPHPSQQQFSWDEPSPALEAKLRMVRLPIDETQDQSSQAVFVDDQLWVPISVVNGNIHILPGVPRLFEALLDGLRPKLLPRLVDPEGKGMHRILFSTPLAESEVAIYLTELASKLEPEGIKVGSYPRFGENWNTVTLVGRDKDYLEELIPEVEKGIQGKHITSEEESAT